MPERPWYREPAAFFAEDAFEEQPAASAEVAVRPAVHPPNYAPGAVLPEVRTGRDGVVQYAYMPTPVPQGLDVRSQRMAACGVMAFGVGAGTALVEVGSYVMFAGMALATHAIIGVAAAFVSLAVSLVALKTMGGVKIGHFHQGDNSTFSAGNQR
jgi:hypothetical protein